MTSDDSAEHRFVQWAKQAAAPICTLDPSALDTLKSTAPAGGWRCQSCRAQRGLPQLQRFDLSSSSRDTVPMRGPHSASEALLYKRCPDRGPTIAVAVALVLGQLALALRSAKHADCRAVAKA